MHPPHFYPALAYIVRWRRVALVLTCVGWLLALFVADITTVVIFAIVGVMGSVVVNTLLDTRGWRRRRPAPPTAYGALAGAGFAVAAATAVKALGPLGCLVVAVMVVSSPLVLSLAVDLRLPDPPSHDEVVPVATVSTATMSTTALVHAWCGSFAALARARTSTARAAVAARRCEYLDELERRHPDAMRRWLDSGAFAAGDPSRFFGGWADSSS
jgi:hypothetical protein